MEKFDLVDHRLAPCYKFSGKVLYEERPVYDSKGEKVEGLHSIWITLNNPEQLNSYTTEMVKEVILAFQHAGMDRRAVAVVFTGADHKALCTGGNTKEYAEYYAGRPMEYGQYMWLFNMMVNSILLCQHPVICRVNGMRIAGGQEIGMACDFTISGDHALFGQAGPRHGSAPVGGSTDFLPGFVSVEIAMNSGVLCKSWNAHEAKGYGLITDHVQVYKKDSDVFITNPFLENIPRSDAKAIISNCEIDLSHLDNRVNQMITELMYLMPNCVMKTIDEIRRIKWEPWSRNFPSHRQWLMLNMATDGQAGFTAFNSGSKKIGQTVDFIKLRWLQAEGHKYDVHLINEILQDEVELPV